MPRRSYGRFPPYVPVAARRQQARRELDAQAAATGRRAAPVVASAGRRQIATSVWGRAWCDNLERYGDLANRLPRGRTYLRNGSVVDLVVSPGRVAARVMGSSLYRVEIGIEPVGADRWRGVKQACRGKIGSLVGLLRGQLSPEVLEVITRPKTGLFPEPRELRLSCSCPDAAHLCKHLAATLYGVGVRLDTAPELFFVLRQVDQTELVSAALEGGVPGPRPSRAKKKTIAADRLADVFGIDVDPRPPRRRR